MLTNVDICEQLQCRLCSRIAEKFHNALSNQLIRINVQKYLRFVITDTDPHSKLICDLCFHRLTDFDEYCNKVAEYQQCLKNAVATRQNDKICEENPILTVEPTSSKSNGSPQPESITSPSQASIEAHDEEVNDLIASVQKSEKSAVSALEYIDTPLDEHNDDTDNDCNETDVEYANDVEEVDLRTQNLAHLQLDTFPTKLIEDAKLIVKGAELNDLISRFYLLDCDYCKDGSKKLRFCDLAELLQHYIDKHQMKGYVFCCNTKLVKIHAMAMHMARHLQPNAFQCPQCNKVLTCPRILQYHIQNHLPETKRPLACDQCPRRFSYKGALITHMISHQPENKRAAYICDECGREFRTGGRLTNHINVEHIENTKRVQEYVCNICSKRFTYGCNLAYHMTTHQPYAKQVQCAKCSKWLKNKSCLRKHMQQHSMVRYPCSQCSYTTSNQQCLKRHVRVQHSDDKPFRCSDCDKAFKLKTTLTAHMFQHTGDRKYVCEFCNRSFVSNGNYYSHRKRMHSTELAAMILQKEHDKRQLRETNGQ